MENEELIEKLAEFAEFRKKGTAYVWPDGKFDFAPNFPESLDACFKWLVPKFTMQHPLITFNTNDENYSCCSIHAGQKSYPGWGTPALALCKAIEELIDKEENHA